VKDEMLLERKVLEQLREIFPEASRTSDWRGSPDLPVSRADIIARSRNGRTVLFDVKAVNDRARLPSSWYIQLASYRDHLVAAADGPPPILVLIVNARLDEPTTTTFAKSGIPVFQIGDNVKETRMRMRAAFHHISIELPEFESGTPSRILHFSRCFVTLPRKWSHGPLRNMIDVTLRASGGEVNWGPDVVLALGPGLAQRSHFIRTCDIVIADLTGADPIVLLDIGIATAFGLPVVLLSQEGQIPRELSTERVEYYDTSVDGLERLCRRLPEIMRPLEFRKRPQV
jgi:hypothetical protein